MYVLRISGLTKKFKINETQEKTVLDNVSLILPSSGLVAIVGKSGSGKSTLLNMISLLDKPTAGRVYFMNENTATWKKKRIEQYLNKDIGIVFQNYHLLENETGLFNVALPLLISGEDGKIALQLAKNLLEDMGIREELYLRKCRDMSGGEKERIAILRAIINNPKVVLADEPTGALDSNNSILVMDIFKKISQKRLVVFVTHNTELVKKYANQIISIKDGKVESDEGNFMNEDQETITKDKTKQGKSSWCYQLTKSNFMRRRKRNLFSVFGLVIGLVSSMLIMGFAFGHKESIKTKSYSQFNFGVATLYKQTTQNISGSKMALVQMSKLSDDEMNSISDELSLFEIEPNTDALLPMAPRIISGEVVLDELSYCPVYSFNNSFIDKSLLINGELPNDDLHEVVINKSAYKYLKNKFNAEPIGLEFVVHSDYENHYYTDDSGKPVITDYFIFDNSVIITGVVDDFYFLSTPKMYYSYSSFKEYLYETILVNLSAYLDYEVCWYDYLLSVDGNNPLSSYSSRVFLKEITNTEKLEMIIKQIPDPYVLESTPITICETFLNLMDAATIGMELFLVITLTGTVLIMGIISFSSYSEDKKTSAILTCMGARRGDIFSIYFYENLLLGCIALGISLILSPILSLIGNQIILKLTGFESMINIPFLSLLNFPLLFPIILVVATLLVCVVSTYIPLFFSKKISPREELMEE